MMYTKAQSMGHDVGKELKKYFSQFKLLSFKKNEIILRSEDEIRDIYYVKSGYVRMFTVFEDGRELTLNIFKPGSFFPMVLVMADIKNYYYFQTMTSVDLYRAGRELVLDFVKKNPEVFYDLTRRISIGLMALTTNIEHLFYGSADSRIISVLFLLAARFGEKTKNGRVVINLPLTHQAIASMIGITRETATGTLNKLLKKGLVNYQKRLFVIVNIERLRREAKIYVDESLQDTF